MMNGDLNVEVVVRSIELKHWESRCHLTSLAYWS